MRLLSAERIGSTVLTVSVSTRARFAFRGGLHVAAYRSAEGVEGERTIEIEDDGSGGM